MALKFPDRCRETSTSTGTGAITLGGATAMHRAFSDGLANADTTYFLIAARDGSGWELVLGTYTSASNSLSRDTVVASTNAGAKVNFGAGVKDVMSAWPGGVPIPVSQGGTGAATVAAAHDALKVKARNYFMNSGCQVAQRGDVSFSSNTLTRGGADLIFLTTSGWTTVSGTLSQRAESNAVSGSKVQVWGITTTGNGTIALNHRLEASTIKGLIGKTVTISAVIAHGFGSTLDCVLDLYKPNVADDYTASTWLAAATVSVPSGTPTVVSITRQLTSSDISNGLQLTWRMSPGAVSNKIFEAWDFQLVEGSERLPVEVPDAALEGLRCRRYFEIVNPAFGGYSANGMTELALICYKNRKRITPAVVYSTNTSNGGFPSSVGTLSGDVDRIYESRVCSLGSPSYGWFTSTLYVSAEL